MIIYTVCADKEPDNYATIYQEEVIYQALGNLWFNEQKCHFGQYYNVDGSLRDGYYAFDNEISAKEKQKEILIKDRKIALSRINELKSLIPEKELELKKLQQELSDKFFVFVVTLFIFIFFYLLKLLITKKHFVVK